MGLILVESGIIGPERAFLETAGRVCSPGSKGRPSRRRGGKLTQQDDRNRQMAAMRERLTRLSEASLRINESVLVKWQGRREPMLAAPLGSAGVFG